MEAQALLFLILSVAVLALLFHLLSDPGEGDGGVPDDTPFDPPPAR